MMGTLRKIEITNDLIMKVAREKFAVCNEGLLDDQREYVRIDWIKNAHDMLEDFNDLACIFKKINIECETDNFGGYHDVEEFYKE